METSVVRRWFVAVALAAFAVVCAIQLVFELSVEPWLKLAIRMEAASEPLDMSEDVRASLIERISERETGICGDLAKSRVTVAFDLLKRNVAEKRPPAVVEASTLAAAAIVRDGLYCTSADANLWFLLAYLESKAGGSWSEVQKLLVMSASRAPRDGALLLQRSLLVSLLLSKNAEPLEARLQADLQTALATLEVRSLLPVLAKLQTGGRADLLKEMTDRLPKARQTALAEGGAPKRSTFGRGERYRTFEFHPFDVPEPPALTP